MHVTCEMRGKRGRNPRYEIDNMIVKILEYRKSLRYTELFEEVNRRGERKKPSSPIVDRTVRIGYKPEVQWKKPPNTTFDRHLWELEHRDILRKEYKYRNTYYSLIEGFKYSLDKHKRKYPTTYLERALQEFSMVRYPSDDEKAIEIVKPSEDKN